MKGRMTNPAHARERISNSTRRTNRWQLLGTILAALVATASGILLVGGAGAFIQTPGAVEREYTLSNHHEDEVLSLRKIGVPYPTRHFTLYGDGRLVGRLRGHREQDPDFEPPVEVWLSREEMREIVDIIVDGGLIEYEPGDTRKILGRPIVTYGSTSGLWLRVALESYESPQRQEFRPFVHATGVGPPGIQMERYQRAKEAGRLPADAPDTFVEAEAILHLYKHLEHIVYGDEHP